jgi:hypothetical protein
VDEAREDLSDTPYPTEKSSIELNKNAILVRCSLLALSIVIAPAEIQ